MVYDLGFREGFSIIIYSLGFIIIKKIEKKKEKYGY